MSAVRRCKIRNLLSSFVLVTLILSSSLFSAESQAGALRQLAEANNAVYRETRDLGNSATPGAIADIQRKHFGPALGALQSEHYEKYLGWKRAIKNAMTESKAEIARILGLDGKGAAGGPAHNGEAPKPVLGRVNTDTSTGVQGGEGGAKDTHFNNKREQKKVVVDQDGIVIDQ